MKVYKTEHEDGTYDYNFNIIYQKLTDKKNDDTPLPGDEVSRRNNIKGLKLYCNLLINGRVVSQTLKVPMNWPEFSAQFTDVFQVHVFTMPSSIQLELILQDGIFSTQVDLITVDVPGQHVKTLTCASQLI